MSEESGRNNRGELGTASAGDKLKKRHRDHGRGLSLKTFARDLLKEGDDVAKEWFANKRGEKQMSRSEKNAAAAVATAQATKASRHKGKK